MRLHKNTSRKLGRQLSGALFIFLAAFILLSNSGHSETPSASALAEYQAFSEGQRVRLLIDLAKSGQHDTATQLIEKYPLQGEHAPNRTLYIEGLILKAKNDFSAARDKFRTALASDPSLTLVRSDLAETLYLLEDDEAAKHHLKLLESEAPTAEAANSIRAFIDQIDTRRPYTINAYLAFAPTSNINNRTYRKTVYGFLNVPDSLREKSAYGLAAGINGSFNHRLGDNLRGIISGNVEARIYNHSEFNSVSTSEAAELRRSYDNGYVSFGIVSSQDFSVSEEELTFISYGPRVLINHSLTPKDEISARALYEWHNVIGSQETDARVLTLATDYTHAFDSAFNVTLSAGYLSNNANSQVNSFDTWSGGLSLYKEFGYGLTFNVGGDIRYSKFTPEAMSREDWKYIGSIGFTKRDFSIFGLAPSLEYTYIQNNSSNEFFDYASHAIDLKFTKAF
jgi:outer membrane protein